MTDFNRPYATTATQAENRVLRADNERLRAALQRIDGINDNPAVYNPMIEEVLRGAALEPKP
jgi:phage major head subunit gpT-like protein